MISSSPRSIQKLYIWFLFLNLKHGSPKLNQCANKINLYNIKNDQKTNCNFFDGAMAVDWDSASRCFGFIWHAVSLPHPYYVSVPLALVCYWHIYIYVWCGVETSINTILSHATVILYSSNVVLSDDETLAVIKFHIGRSKSPLSINFNRRFHVNTNFKPSTRSVLVLTMPFILGVYIHLIPLFHVSSRVNIHV